MMLTLKMVERALTRTVNGPGDSTAVSHLNIEGVALMMRGENEAALNNFLRALEYCHADLDLQAECFGNLGDFARRIDGNQILAMQLILRGYIQATSSVTESRLLTHLAQTMMLPLELSDPHDNGSGSKGFIIDTASSILEEAMARVRGQLQAEAVAARLLATRRHIALTIQYGDTEEKTAASQLILRILGEAAIADYPDEQGKLRMWQAELLSETEPRLAADLFEDCGEKLEVNSPLDACHCFCRAAELFWLAERQSRYEAVIQRASKLEGFLETHINASRIKEELNRARELATPQSVV